MSLINNITFEPNSTSASFIDVTTFFNVTESVNVTRNRGFFNMTSGPLFDFVEKESMDVNIYPLVFAVLWAILGFFGNVTVIYIYLTKWKKTRTRVFILCLGILDLCNCAFSMPMEVAILWYPLSFDYDTLCKITRGVTYVFNNTGSLVFVSIAIERFLIVHYPLKSRRLTPRFSKGMCLLSFLIASAVSWPSFVFYGTHTLTIPIPQYHVNVIGKTCLIADEHEIRKGTILIYTSILFGLLVLTFVILSALYISIGRKIYMAACTDISDGGVTPTRAFSKSIISALTGVTKQKDLVQLRRHSSAASQTTSISTNGSASDLELSHSGRSFWSRFSNRKSKSSYIPDDTLNGTIVEESSCLDAADSASTNRLSVSFADRKDSTVSAKPTGRRLSRKYSTIKQKATRKNTLMMRVVTIAFMLSYTPFLVILIIRYTHTQDSLTYYLSLPKANKIAYKVFLNSYFINSMINPYIYGFMNAEFRQMVKQLFASIFCAICLRKRQPQS